MFNQEVFDKGIAVLSNETLKLTEFIVTRITGSISVLKDGLRSQECNTVFLTERKINAILA